MMGEEPLNNDSATLWELNILDSEVDLSLDEDDSPRDSSVQIFVKMPNGRTLTFKTYPRARVSKIMTLIEDQEEIPSKEQGLSYGNEPLDDGDRLWVCE